MSRGKPEPTVGSPLSGWRGEPAVSARRMPRTATAGPATHPTVSRLNVHT